MFTLPLVLSESEKTARPPLRLHGVGWGRTPFSIEQFTAGR